MRRCRFVTFETGRAARLRQSDIECVIPALGRDPNHRYLGKKVPLTAVAPGKGTCAMKKVLVAVITIISVVSLSGCGSDWIGKGKGKAPPPAAEPAPVYK